MSAGDGFVNRRTTQPCGSTHWLTAPNRSPSGAETAQPLAPDDDERPKTEADEPVGSLKRKSPPQPPAADGDEVTPKRARIADDEEPKRQQDGQEPRPDPQLQQQQQMPPPPSEARRPVSSSSSTREEERQRRASLSEPDRHKGILQEERKRGQRLFGGLMSTLSQTDSNSQHKRRLEIERRQQERAQQQKIEDDKRRAEKLARLTEIRKVEQIKFDEKAVGFASTVGPPPLLAGQERD